MQLAGNLIAIPEIPSATEAFETLLQSGEVTIERIVSHAAASPPDFWYGQDWDEWVILLRGEAELLMEAGGAQPLRAGDYRFIPRRAKHRVESTSADVVWLAVHIGKPRAMASR
jgi:cupin 2 domain-containing protein